MVGYRDYLDLPVMDPVDKTEREVRKEVPASTVQVTGPLLRGFPHPFYAGIDFRCEGSAHIPLSSARRISSSVPMAIAFSRICSISR